MKTSEQVISRYRDHVAAEMKWLAKKPKTVFIGEGLINAGRVYGTMDGVPLRKCIEMPIAENLIMGSAIGLALAGYRPVVVFQRMDFMLIATDQIINHLVAMPKMSGGTVIPNVIIRAIIGSRNKKFDVGIQHNQNYSRLFRSYMSVYDFGSVAYKGAEYREMYNLGGARMIVEDRDKYDDPINVA